mmetsp:Transcript_84203/g.163588  ORF Transcript_84203/g.163588 Transcript_84203/m.163588 type:complete len:112 (+) Transcript_84203:739-1074(+)
MALVATSFLLFADGLFGMPYSPFYGRTTSSRAQSTRHDTTFAGRGICYTTGAAFWHGFRTRNIQPGQQALVAEAGAGCGIRGTFGFAGLRLDLSPNSGEVLALVKSVVSLG